MASILDQLENLGCDVGTDELGNIRSIQGYDLRLSEICPLLAQASELEDLSLSDAIVDLPWVNLPPLAKLSLLTADHSILADSDLELLRKYPDLAYLDLANTQITDRGMLLVAELKCLTHLVLSNDQITDEGLISVCACSEIHHLYVQGTNVTENGVVATLKALPIQYMNLCNCSNISTEQMANIRRSFPAVYFDG